MFNLVHDNLNCWSYRSEGRATMYLEVMYSGDLFYDFISHGRYRVIQLVYLYMLISIYCMLKRYTTLLCAASYK